MTAWDDGTRLDPVARDTAAWLRAVRRGVPLAVVTFGCLGLLLLVRLVERPIFGMRRPVTPYITQFVCKSAFLILGMNHTTEGAPMTQPGAVVANHVSWLDIFALNAPQRIYYVAKSEVAGWPGIGWLARATGTVFVVRKRSEAARQKIEFEDRLLAGHRLLFFPEGTSTDGIRVLPFKTTLFAAFFDDRLRSEVAIQPVTVVYTAPEGQDPRFYGWWGDMGFGDGLLSVLMIKRPGSVKVVFHPPENVADFADRKSLAAAMEQRVRGPIGQLGIPTD